MREAGLQRKADYQTDFGDPGYLTRSYIFSALISVSSYARGKLLDIGCGNKPYRSMFPDVTEHIGCDIALSDLNLVDILCDSTNIPLRCAAFDTVLSTQAIEHVEDPWKLCDEAFRLLKPGGHFIVSGPMYWKLHEEPFDFYRFTKHGFKHMLERSGFEVLEIIPCGGKWAMCGLVFIHAIENTRLLRPAVIKPVNRFFAWLDRKKPDHQNTSNYVVAARKP